MKFLFFSSFLSNCRAEEGRVPFFLSFFLENWLCNQQQRWLSQLAVVTVKRALLADISRREERGENPVSSVRRCCCYCNSLTPGVFGSHLPASCVEGPKNFRTSTILLKDFLITCNAIREVLTLRFAK